MKSKTLFLVVLAVTALLASNAFAGYDSSVDPFEPGSEPISLEDVFSGMTFTFEGLINYDVYDQGEYNGQITTADGATVSVPADHYVYQYQVISTSGFAVGLHLALVPGGVGDNFGYAASGDGSDVIPNAVVDDVANLASFSFTLLSGQHTAMLLFTSPNGPAEGDGIVSAMAGNQEVVVPVPIPEPITLFLLGAGCLPLRYYRRRFRKAV